MNAINSADFNALLTQVRELPPEEASHALENVIHDLFVSDLFRFAKYGLNYSALTESTHGKVCEILSSPSPRKLICLPRGTFKSSLCSVAYPIWRLAQKPNLRILLDSEVYENSKNFIREIKGKLLNPALTWIFGDFCGKDKQGNDLPWNEGEIIIKQRSVVRKEASITAGGVGTEKTGQHYDIIIADDLNSPKNSMTPENRKKVIDHYRYLQAILEPEGEMVIVGTRYFEDDIIGWILKNELGLDPIGRELFIN